MPTFPCVTKNIMPVQCKGADLTGGQKIADPKMRKLANRSPSQRWFRTENTCGNAELWVLWVNPPPPLFWQFFCPLFIGKSSDSGRRRPKAGPRASREVDIYAPPSAANATSIIYCYAFVYAATSSRRFFHFCK